MSAARTRQMRILRPLVFDRARGMCEAGDQCPHRAEELQHALPRSRARDGDEHLLDREAVRALDADEFDPARHLVHLLAVCSRCHQLAHGNPQWAMSIGLTIPGEVRTGVDGRPVYTGSHGRLRDLWGREVAA